jgi:hypothetical protein
LVIDAACHQLLLNHLLTLRRKIENGRDFLPTTGGGKRSKNQSRRDPSHPPEYRRVRCYESSIVSLLRFSIAAPQRSCDAGG